MGNCIVLTRYMLDCAILETDTCSMAAKLVMMFEALNGQQRGNGDYGVVAARTEQSNGLACIQMMDSSMNAYTTTILLLSEWILLSSWLFAPDFSG